MKCVLEENILKSRDTEIRDCKYQIKQIRLLLLNSKQVCYVRVMIIL